MVASPHGGNGDGEQGTENENGERRIL